MSEAVTLEEILRFLMETPMFSGLSTEELGEVLPTMQVQRVRSGQMVFQEGDEGDGWYVLYAGSCTVSRGETLSQDRTIATLAPHSCFGEMAVLDGSPRSATVRADGDVVVFRFPTDPFAELLEGDSLAAFKLIHQMARVLCARQRELNQRLTDVMVSGDGPAPVVIRRNIGELLDSLSVSE